MTWWGVLIIVGCLAVVFLLAWWSGRKKGSGTITSRQIEEAFVRIEEKSRAEKKEHADRLARDLADNPFRDADD